jgi:hypothetical protein
MSHFHNQPLEQKKYVQQLNALKCFMDETLFCINAADHPTQLHGIFKIWHSIMAQ